MSYQKQRCLNCGLRVLSGENPENCAACGHRDWEQFCVVHKSIFTSSFCSKCGYFFKDSSFTDTSELASALSSNWSEGLYAIRVEPLLYDWVESALGRFEQARVLRLIYDRDGLDPDKLLAIILIALDPTRELFYKNVTLNPATCHQNIDFILDLLNSPVPECINLIGVHPWLPSLAVQWRNFLVKTDLLFNGLPIKPEDSVLLKILMNWPITSNAGETMTASLLKTKLKMGDFAVWLSGRPDVFRKLRESYLPLPILSSPPHAVDGSSFDFPTGKHATEVIEAAAASRREIPKRAKLIPLRPDVLSTRTEKHSHFVGIMEELPSPADKISSRWACLKFCLAKWWRRWTLKR